MSSEVEAYGAPDVMVPYQKHSDVLDQPQARHFASVTFIYLLVGSTVFFYPFALLIDRFVGRIGYHDSGVAWNAFMYSAAMHVAMTAIFYVDPAMFALMRHNRIRFMAIAPLAFLGTFWLWTLGTSRTQAYFMLAYVLWTYWHFQKQHWGVYSFVRIHEKSRPQSIDRLVVVYGSYLPAAIIWGTSTIASGGNAEFFWSPVVRAANVINHFALPIVVMSAAAAVYAIVREVRSARSAGRPIAVLSLAMLAFFSCNNWPFLIFDVDSLAIAMVNTGHGLQYIIFMTVFAYDRNRVYRLLDKERPAGSLASAVSRRIDARWLGHIVGVLYLVGMVAGANWLFHGGYARALKSAFFVGLTLSTGQMALVAQALGLAITVVHYILDASAWRLTQPEARAVMRQKFDFIFSRQARPGVGV